MGNRPGHDPIGHATARATGFVQKQSASVAACFHAAFAMWCPTTVFGPKLASRAAERSLVILGKAVSGNSVEGGNGVSNGVPALKTWWEQATSAFLRKCYPFRAFHQLRSMKCLFQEGCDSLMLETPCTHMSTKEDTALVWCECGFGPVHRVAFGAHYDYPC